MQTIKTAAIVVLLLTVIYGAYVSMTTPPQPLPEEIEGMLVLDDDVLEIDAGLPESLENLQQIDDLAPIDTVDRNAAFDNGMSLPQTDMGSTEIQFSDQQGNPASDHLAHLGAAPVDPAANHGTDSAVTTHLSDSSTPSPAGSLTIDPPVGSSTRGHTGHQDHTHPNYPRTTHTFELPDPNNVDAISDTPSNVDLALASNTSPASSSAVPAAGTVIDNPPVVNSGVSNAIRTADRQYTSDRRKEALATLSLFYNSPNLSGEQRSALLARLDPLAREVIYSRKHLLERPYRVGQDETLLDVAVRYEVPWQLLANINQITDPMNVSPGTELKVVRGPFRAEISLSAKELTLFLGDLYAGRFPVEFGDHPSPRPGTFTVQDKQPGHVFYDASGTPIPPGSPDNPYGQFWIDLGGQLCIHGSPDDGQPTTQGCISLAGDYVDDLYGILSQGSSVTIRP